MSYKIKEIFYTLQGEGAHAGRPAVFCRFSACNLWTGHERDRARAICKFCDTDFVGTNGINGGKFSTADELAAAIAHQWPQACHLNRMVVLTGGEPLLQVDESLTTALHKIGFYVAVETNGTRPVPRGIDWVCVSPKQGAELIVHQGDELKLVYPQAGDDPTWYEKLDFGTFRLQPMDGESVQENTAAAVRYCLENPRWQLSLQTHKLLGIP
ncbi:7-carboxy-7-deazaguanine synthase [Lolliginicoccus suaedae]|uniref:7-carboxy-7-deazaguanine synthase n=1 Tax=Lolliginicoccus suaedae TaxID=2605429 RepID=UPI0011EC0A9B|nr:7-carboxy-7-deazaguanine synthase [Lolliginicoccus suaedae]